MRSRPKRPGCHTAGSDRIPRHRITLAVGAAALLLAGAMVGEGAGGDDGPGMTWRTVRSRRAREATNRRSENSSRLISSVRGRRQGPSSGDDGPTHDIWKREFAQPESFPVTVRSIGGDDFQVESAHFGLLRSVTNEDLYDVSATDCDVTWRIVPDAEGYSLVYTVINATDQTQPLPSFRVHGNLLGDRVEFLQTETDTRFAMLDASGGTSACSRIDAYPDQLYSPVMVVRNQQLAVGFSLLYPILDYEHAIRTKFFRGENGTRYEGSWFAEFRLDGTVPAGQARLYELAVRYTKADDWIHSLAPYRAYFQKHYGEVRYRQDMRPVYGMTAGDSAWLSQTNPRGLSENRADLNGWKEDVDDLVDHINATGYKRVMVWNPGGLYLNHTENNFPPQIMSSWLGPMRRTAGEWKRLNELGIDVMYWWGHSSKVADKWDDPTLEDFNPKSRRHRRSMLREYGIAQSRGADGIGFDAFHMQVWDAIPWLHELQARNPGSTFVIEPAGCDILHVKYPTFVQANRLKTPHLLADYLVPGRELWVYMRPTEATHEMAKQFIDWGLTVVTKSPDIDANQLQEWVDNGVGGN
ncbi:MAG: hypothetical protein HND57_10625 [Planctomycetes bacterium]|nr:hypothetical protein [Planctomycetota bacterium]